MVTKVSGDPAPPCSTDTAVEKKNGKTTDTVNISLLILSWTTFAFNTAAALLGMDSNKIRTVSSGILYHST
jgi:hypothetical protein